MKSEVHGPKAGLRHGRSVVVLCLGLLIGAGAGCAGSGGRTATPAERPRGLERADAAFLAGDYETAADEYQQLLSRSEAGPWAAAAGARLGLSYLERRAPAAAMSAFRQAEAANPDPATAAQIVVGEGNAALALGDFTTAAERFRTALAEHGGRVRRERVERALAQAESRTAAAPAAPAGSAGGYTVQVGAFAEAAGASARAKEVERAGFRCEVRPVAKAGRTLYQVCVGRYDTWGDANAAARSLRAKGISAVVSP